jgi:hypothetical protein
VDPANDLMKAARALRAMGPTTLADLPHDQLPGAYASILTTAKAKGFNGTGGHCGTAAVAINRVLFAGKGQIIGAFNDFFLGHDHHVGHVAVEFSGAIWDADGQPKDMGELEAWGMLDPEDPDWAEQAADLGGEWDDTAASEAGVFELTDQEALEAFGDHGLGQMTATLKQCLAEYLSTQGARG